MATAPSATNPQLRPPAAGNQHQESPTYSHILRLASLGIIYDVFLNFRGKDTRIGFTGYLYKALVDKNFITFFDQMEISVGTQIRKGLEGAIKKSRIFIIIISENYADSQFCLDELVEILDFTKGDRGLILPVFYYVDPCQLQDLTDGFKEAFAKHQERYPNKVEKWKAAIREVADLKNGFHLKKGETKFEHAWISEIVDEVNRLDGLLHIALMSQVNKVVSLLELESDGEVHMVGIFGSDQIPIMTVARRVYELNTDRFDSFCILDNVKESSINFGLEQLQEKLISKTVECDLTIEDVKKGISMIKYMLHQKKVLLVLHNVGMLAELQATVGQTDWFCSGSRVIITTQEDQSLLKSHGLKRIYNEDVIVHAKLEDGI